MEYSVSSMLFTCEPPRRAIGHGLPGLGHAGGHVPPGHQVQAGAQVQRGHGLHGRVAAPAEHVLQRGQGRGLSHAHVFRRLAGQAGRRARCAGPHSVCLHGEAHRGAEEGVSSSKPPAPCTTKAISCGAVRARVSAMSGSASARPTPRSWCGARGIEKRPHEVEQGADAHLAPDGSDVREGRVV